jgi:hypothetical protein
MSKFADRVRETSTTTGTGTLNLGGVFDASYRTFVAGIGTAKPVIYAIRHQDATLGEWEVGLGVVTDAATDTLSRLKVLSSSNAGALVNFSAGTKDVFCPWTAWHADNVHQIPRRVKCATTTAGTLASDYENGDTVDGITLATGDRILVKNQATASENGIYLVAASGAPARVVDLYTGDGAAGVLTIVEQGTVNGDTAWLCTTNSGSDVVGTGDLAFVPVATGPTSATDNAIARYDGTSGGKLQNSGWTISDTAKAVGPASAKTPYEFTDAATIDIDWNDSDKQYGTLGGNRTFTFTSVTLGQSLKLRLIQDGTGSRTITWPSGIYWPGGVAPTLTTTASRWDVIVLDCIGIDGSGVPTFEGYIAGQNFGA